METSMRAAYRPSDDGATYATSSSHALMAATGTLSPTSISSVQDGKHERSSHEVEIDDTSPPKPKQKRNKPTLSCLECVERKTKCNRGRPCLACVKRQSTCEYTLMANILASSADKSSGRQSSDRTRYINKPPTKKHKTKGMSPLQPRSGRFSPFLLSTASYAQNNPSNVFGFGTQHPFSNYWTCSGGLAEVIGILPSKEQGDILIAKYFDAVDPAYPFLHRRSFYADYERFWSLSREQQAEVDPSLLALLYVMFALGTQFLPLPYQERSQTAEFYCSAAHQALRIYSYLNRTSMRAISAMMLITYFLMNGSHASDSYAWAGIHLRQAYAMRLHRDPEVIVPHASVLEKQLRRKLWQAIFQHDTFLTILLKLPPMATHSDVEIDSLVDENDLHDELEVEVGTHSRVENLMSISAIAPQDAMPLPPSQPHHVVDFDTRRNDNAYIRSMWCLAQHMQETLSSPVSLDLPIVNSSKHKDSLINAFHRLYKSFPSHLTHAEPNDVRKRALSEPRKARQQLFLLSNYYHCLMLLHAAENEDCEVECDFEATLEAAHRAMWTFFHLWQCFPGEAAVWWVFQHRAFEESLLVAHILSLLASLRIPEAACDRAKDDLLKMIDIMERYGEEHEIHKTRKAVLRESFEKIMM